MLVLFLLTVLAIALPFVVDGAVACASTFAPSTSARTAPVADVDVTIEATACGYLVTRPTRRYVAITDADRAWFRAPLATEGR